jgi:predicted nucleic acid-binding protein
MKILVDSSVLLDVLTQGPQWPRWSEEKLALHAKRDLLAINAIIHAEVSVHFSTQEELEQVLSHMDFQRLPLPYDAAFLAAKCFLTYRRHGGQKRAPLPDFYIGAHAATAKLALLTRDVSRYRTYYPSVQLIIPGQNSPIGSVGSLRKNRPEESAEAG